MIESMNLPTRAAAIICFAVLFFAARSPAQTAPVPSISPDARQLLDRIRDGYASLKTLQITGTVHADLDIDGQTTRPSDQFTGLFDQGKFRHEMKDDVIAGNTGQTVYLYLPANNIYEKYDVAPERLYLEACFEDLRNLIRGQDLSLALALSRDASAELFYGVNSITQVDDLQIDSAAYPAIKLAQLDSDVTLAIDPKTGLIRRALVDFTRRAKNRGAVDVKSALITVDYQNVPGGAVDAGQFAWTPPAGSQALTESPQEGKPAPAFALPTLDGKAVSTDDLKGTVYVLDFWATWCGPCVVSMPNLDKMYRELSAKGLRVFAVNQMETKEKVQQFYNDKQLALTVLLDADGKASEAFDVEGLPTTVIVGRDGKIRKIFIGIDREDMIRPEVEAALAQH